MAVQFDVTVTTGGGTSTPSSADLFTFNTPPNGVVGGSVTSSVTGLPLAGVSVTVTSYLNCCSSYSTTTDLLGNWSVSLPGGSYTVAFQLSGYATQYWRATSYQYQQPIVVASGGSVVGISAVLAPNGTIRGTVTDSGGSPLAGVSVNVNLQNQGGSASAVTGVDGTWSASEAPGTYYVSFSLPGYATQYWNNTTNFSSSQAVVVTPGATASGVNATLALNGTVSGTVTSSSSGTPLSSVSVCVSTSPSPGYCFGSAAVTAANGSWALSVAPGTYYVSFSLPGYVAQ